jgi:hypothetical protein
MSLAVITAQCTAAAGHMTLTAGPILNEDSAVHIIASRLRLLRTPPGQH